MLVPAVPVPKFEVSGIEVVLPEAVPSGVVPVPEVEELGAVLVPEVELPAVPLVWAEEGEVKDSIAKLKVIAPTPTVLDKSKRFILKLPLLT